jgi:hypothetical protein
MRRSLRALICCMLVVGIGAGCTTASIAPAQPSVSRAGERRVDVRSFGAQGDGKHDDTASIEAAVHAACDGTGRSLYFPAGTYLIVRTLRLIGAACSHVSVVGDGPASVLRFAPKAPFEVTRNDRVFYIESQVTTAAPLASPVRLGDRQLVLARPTQLREGEWLVVFERDAAVSDIVIVDWCQVAEANGVRVQLHHPARTAFPKAREWIADASGLGYIRLHSLLENVVIRDLRIVVAPSRQPVVGINIGMALRTSLQNVHIENPSGNALAIYRAKDVGIQNVVVSNSARQANEIAATVDFRVTNSSFGFQHTSSKIIADTAALTIDYGSAFFTVTANTFSSAGNIAVMLLHGVHDGAFVANAIGWTRDAGIGRGQGLTSKGSQRVIVHANTFAGGDSQQQNTCVNFERSGELRVPIESRSNVITENVCMTFANETGTRSETDKYR